MKYPIELVSLFFAFIITCVLAGIKVLVPVPIMEWWMVFSPMILWLVCVSAEAALIIFLLS